MKQNDIQALCTAINKGMYLQSFHREREYSLEEDSIQENLTMSFSPEVNYYGEKLLKAKFYGVDDLVCNSLFDRIFQPIVTIKDMSVQGYETLSYFVDEAENEFYFYCENIEFWWEG